MKRDLTAQIKVGFEKAFSIRGTAVSKLSCIDMLTVLVGMAWSCLMGATVGWSQE